jgi:SAM-dependent methyltransferase
MKENVFGAKYAAYYDLLYQDKNYRLESERIDGIIRNFAPVCSELLELGSGTGGHAIHLARKYKVTAIERSRHMVEIARKKTGTLPIRFVQADITSIPSFQERFDACISIFHVLNYLSGRNELKEVLTGVHSLLKENGIMIFDSWNGLAVIKERPTVRVKLATDGNMRVIRIVYPKLDVLESTCTNTYHHFVLKEGKVIDEYEEKHTVRYYFPKEIKEIVDDCGFEILQLTNDQGECPGESDWSIQIVARRRT